MALENKWIRYVDRSYLQIKQRVLQDMQVLTPEITDHTESNPYVTMLSIWAGIAEMLGYYIDNSAREAHLSQARLFWSGVKIANAYDYRIHSYLASTGEVTFKINKPAPQDIVIPLNTEVRTESGIKYFSVNEGKIERGNTETTITFKQFENVPQVALGRSDGTANQVFKIEDKVLDYTTTIRVGSDVYSIQDTLALSLPTDKHFVQSVDEKKTPVIKFGDGVNGAIPENGSEITLEYQKTEGAEGNTGAYTINKLISQIALPIGIDSIEVYNKERTSGGSDVETLQQLQRRIPKSLRTLQRAVTKQDFIDVTELKSGVSKAGVTYECGKPVNIYIVPDGGGVASNSLLEETRQWIEDRRLITIGVRVQRAGELRILLGIEINVLPQFPRALTIERVKQNLADFLSYKNQEIAGEVHLSDIYQIVENTQGVKNSVVRTMKPRPYARPVNTDTSLNWRVSITDTSTTSKIWRIKMLTPTLYELSSDGAVLGNYNIGTLYAFNDITLQVENGAYTIGSIWEFYSYPSYGTIDIVEPSLPVSLLEDINVTAKGGL